MSGPNVLLTSVVQTDPIWVNFGMADNEQARIEKAQAGSLKLPRNFEVELRLADGSVYKQKASSTSPTCGLHPDRHARGARRGAEPDGALRPGQFVRVVLRGAVIPNAVTVPQRAVMEGPQGKFVYVVDEKAPRSRARSRPASGRATAG